MIQAQVHASHILMIMNVRHWLQAFRSLLILDDLKIWLCEKIIFGKVRLMELIGIELVLFLRRVNAFWVLTDLFNMQIGLAHNFI